jgi:hypothetical protein
MNYAAVGLAVLALLFDAGRLWEWYDLQGDTTNYGFIFGTVACAFVVANYLETRS